MEFASFLSDRRGSSLIELMIATSISVVIAFFCFDSTRQVIKASMSAKNTVNFDSLSDEIRYTLGKLEQCTCMFQNLQWTPGQATIDLHQIIGAGSPVTIRRYTTTPATLPTAAPCPTAATDTIYGIEGQVNISYSTGIQKISLVTPQYIQAMNVLRAQLQVDAVVMNSAIAGAAQRQITRYYPVLFATKPAAAGAPVKILNCIGMSR